MKELIFLILAACAWAGDAQHGATVLEEQNCLECNRERARYRP